MRFQNLGEWLSWQEQLHPKKIDLGLERVAEAWKRLNPDGLKCKVITVAGTNGKGSCVAMLDAILRAAGYRTGCYTSPHIYRYNERIRIKGAEASDQALCESFERIDQARGEIPLTYFEFSTLAALDLFSRGSLDVVILEVGLGGRLDAVNIIDADAALISTVDMDHMDWLGSDLEQIGREKAGIMRAERPVVFGGTNPPNSLIDYAEEVGARLFLAGKNFHARREGDGWSFDTGSVCHHGLPKPALKGEFQIENAAAVLMLLSSLQDSLPLSQQAISCGLQQVTLPGRFQLIETDVPLLFDVAHNPQAALALRDNLLARAFQGPTHAVFSMLKGKEIEQVARIMRPAIDQWFIAPLDSSRSEQASSLVEYLEEVVNKTHIHCCDSVDLALKSAQNEAMPDGQVLVFGSFYTVAEALEALEL